MNGDLGSVQQGQGRLTVALRVIITAVCAILLAGIVEPIYHNRSMLPLLPAGVTVPVHRVGLYVLFFAFFWISLFRVTGALRRYGWTTRFASVAAGALLATAGFSMLPATSRPVVQPWQIIITATGQMNPQAKSSEVWLRNALANGQPEGMSDFIQEGTWILKDGGLLSSPPHPATLTWSGNRPAPLELIFASHPWCGIVEVKTNGQQTQVDLYSETTTERKVALTGRSGTAFLPPRWALVVSMILAAALILTQGPPQPKTTSDSDKPGVLPGRSMDGPSRLKEAGNLLFAVLGYAVLLVGGVALLLPFTTYPITWDELWYMGLAFSPEPEPHLLNRYAHVYILHGLMRLCGDPYLGARLLYCLTMAGSLLALVSATRPLRLPLRLMVLSTTMLLMLTQDTFTWSLGIAYVDYTVMLATTISVAIVLPDVLRKRPLSYSRSLLLGLVFLLAMRSKDTSIILATLAIIPWIQPDTGLRPTRRGLINMAFYGAGILLGVLAFVVLDAWMLGDPLFSLRPSNWQALLRFGLAPGSKNDLNWLGWMLRPQNFSAFLLYLGTVLPLAFIAKNQRLTVVLTIPLLHLMLLVTRYWAGADGVIARYSLVFLPLVCFLGAYGAGWLLEETVTSPRWKQVIGLAGFLLALAALAAVFLFPAPLKSLAWPKPTFLGFFALPTAVFGTLLLLLMAQILPRLRPPICLLAFGLLMFWTINPALRTVNSVVVGGTKKLGESRFRELRNLTSGLPLTDQSRILVAGDIYEKALANRGAYFARTLLALNARRPLAPEQVIMPKDLSGLSPEKLLSFDYILLEPADLTPTLERIRNAAPDSTLGVRRTSMPDAKVCLLSNPNPRRLPLATRPVSRSSRAYQPLDEP